MELKERPTWQSKLIGGRLCLDFVNTLGGREAAPSSKSRTEIVIRNERLNEYADLLAWSLRTELLSEAEAIRLLRESKQREQEAAKILKRAVALREAIWRICKAILAKTSPTQNDLEVLNAELSAAYGRIRLAAAAGNFRWEWTDTKNSLDRMLWAIADSTAEMLTEDDLSRLRECPGESCGWLFEDTSRNRSRQWCDMQDCGNLAKVRKFRSKPISA